MIPIAKGVNLHYIPSGKFKTAVFCALIRRPLRREEVTWNAALPHILKRGCAKHNTIAKMQTELESLFGSVFECQIVKKGEQQILQFYLESIPLGNNFYRGLAFLRDVMLDPLEEGGSFREEYAAGGLHHLKDMIEGRFNNKTEYARNRCFEEMCADEPFGLQGDGYAEDLPAMDAGALFAHYQKILETSPIDMICVGDLDEAELREKTIKFFASERFVRRDVIAMPAEASDHDSGHRTKQVIEEKTDAVQGKLCIGMRGGCRPAGPEYYALLAANEVLGGGANSRLFARLREKESLCYYIHSVLYRFKSIVLIESGVAKENFEKAAALAQEELDDMKKGHISKEEMENAVSGLIKKFRGGQDYQAAMMDFYMAQHLLGDPDTMDDVIRQVSRVGLDEAAEAAGRLSVDTVFQLA